MANEPKILPKAAQEDKDLAEKLSSEKEFGGPKGEEPTRFGDWEVNGRCSDF